MGAFSPLAESAVVPVCSAVTQTSALISVELHLQWQVRWHNLMVCPAPYLCFCPVLLWQTLILKWHEQSLKINFKNEWFGIKLKAAGLGI